MKVGDKVFLIKAYNNLLPSSIGTIKAINDNHAVINWYIISTNSSKIIEIFNTSPAGYLCEYNTSWWVNIFFTEYVKCINTEEQFSLCIKEKEYTK
jgi:hypothetical protein